MYGDTVSHDDRINVFAIPHFCNLSQEENRTYNLRKN